MGAIDETDRRRDWTVPEALLNAADHDERLRGRGDWCAVGIHKEKGDDRAGDPCKRVVLHRMQTPAILRLKRSLPYCQTTDGIVVEGDRGRGGLHWSPRKRHRRHTVKVLFPEEWRKAPRSWDRQIRRESRRHKRHLRQTRQRSRRSQPDLGNANGKQAQWNRPHHISVVRRRSRRSGSERRHMFPPD